MFSSFPFASQISRTSYSAIGLTPSSFNRMLKAIKVSVRAAAVHIASRQGAQMQAREIAKTLALDAPYR